MTRTLDETLTEIRQSNLTRIRLGHCDVRGGLRVALVAPDLFRQVAQHGADALPGEPAATAGDRLHVDLATFTRVPGEPGTALALCWRRAADGTGHPGCPRSTLARVAGRAREAGFLPVLATGLAFHVFRLPLAEARARRWRDLPPLHGGGAAGAWSAAGEAETFLHALHESARGLGLPVDSLATGAAPGRLEAALRPQPVLEAADQALLFKATVHDVAARLGLCATFMARPSTALPRAHAQLNLALWDLSQTENLFMGPGSRPTPLADAFAAGIADYLGAAAAFLLPTSNSYGWTAAELDGAAVDFALPAPGAAVGGHHGVRVAPGASDLDPYLGAAAALGLGLHGVERRSEAPHATARDHAWTRRAIDLPATWDEALGRLRLSPVARHALGNATVEAYLAACRDELEAQRLEVSDVELARLFDAG
ncbi:MAG: hypothetical protein HY904_07040 [Deltaproteobacteria bacterium]|nr:hypothetical protein [Deltaproteobacteria bacterium]